LEQAVAAGEDFDKAVQQLLTDIITEHGAVVFNGDGIRRTGRRRRPPAGCQT